MSLKARVAKQQADHFEKEAETLRARLEIIESRMSPLRESLESTKNRQVCICISDDFGSNIVFVLDVELSA